MNEVGRKGQALQRSPPLPRRKHTAVGVLVGDFWLKVLVTRDMLFHLYVSSAARACITHKWEGLSRSREQLEQCGRMERFDVGRSQRQRLIDRLPSHVELRTFVLAEVTVTLKTLGVAKLQAVGAGEIPCRTRNRHSSFPEYRPNVA